MRYHFHKSALISASQPDSQASANTAKPRDMGWCTTRYACLLPSFRWDDDDISQYLCTYIPKTL